MMKQIAVIAFFVLLIVGITSLITFATAEQTSIEQAPKTYVADRANVIDQTTETQLIGMLQELEQKAGTRIIVLTVATTGGVPIKNYAFERADAWKFGQNQKSASVLIVVAVKDRKYFIEVGYDHEGVLPDGYVGQVGRSCFVPNFKAGDYGRGILEATVTIAGKVASEKGVTLTGMPQLPKRRVKRRGMVPCGVLPFIAIMVILSFLNRRRRGLMLWGFPIGGSSGGSSGGFGGGGFGSFGGGGGGGFGGGGAGGSW